MESLDPDRVTLAEVDPALRDAYLGRLLVEVGREVPAEDGIAALLANLEPVAKDLSLHGDAVRIMSMQASKGLTVNLHRDGRRAWPGAFSKGRPGGGAPPEEGRRLLYVALTRATDMCVMTFAHRRTGPMARSGTPNVYQARGRCPFFETLRLGAYIEGKEYVGELMRGESFDRFAAAAAPNQALARCAAHHQLRTKGVIYSVHLRIIPKRG